MAKAKIFKDGEEATVRYLHNALGQRVFQGEPTASQTLPNQQTVGQGFIDWLKSNFGWMFQQQATTSIGTAFVYADGHLPSWAILGDYDNGSASGNGRSEYIWLPTGDGAIPMGMFRNGRFFAIHTDHLGTPRLMTNDVNKPVWQWPYSAFGTTKPTGILKATVKPKNAMTNQPVLLKGTVPAQVLNLRDPGQYEDPETGLRDNINRMLSANTGRYTQVDPIGMAGGSNQFIYVGGNPLNREDPLGLFEIIRPNGSPSTFAEAAELGRREALLRRFGDEMQKKINRLCKGDRDQLQAIFDKWRVYVDPNASSRTKRARHAYAYTSYAQQQTQFNVPFFASGSGDPGQYFTFAHEFRHLMSPNSALSRTLDLTGNGPAERDADAWAEQFTSDSCTCGLR